MDDEECAYVLQRYRESHDFYHALTGLPVVREGEVALKAFELANTLLPKTGLAMCAVVTLKPAERRRIFVTDFPWALRNGLATGDIINVYFEEELRTDVVKLRLQTGLEMPPEYVLPRPSIVKCERRLRETRNRVKAVKEAALKATPAAAATA